MAPKKENPTVSSINTLNEHIKSGNFSRIYLLTGTEGYFISQYKASLIEALTTPGDTMNYNVFKGEKVRAEDIASAISTMPFFSDHRTVLVEGTGLLAKASDTLLDVINSVPESTRLIFVETEVDSRTKIYKAIASAGTIARFETPDPSTLNVWVKRILSSEGAQVDDEAVYSLINAVGQDMNRLSNEAAKLRAYTIDRKRITREDVNIICESEAENKVFAMLDAISVHDSRKALLLYSDLEMLKVPPMQTLALIRKRYLQLAQIKMMQKDKEDNAVIAKMTGVHPFYLKDYLSQVKNFELDQLIKSAEMCADADLDIKAGRTTDKNALETLILHLSLSSDKS